MAGDVEASELSTLRTTILTMIATEISRLARDYTTQKIGVYVRWVLGPYGLSVGMGNFVLG